MLNSGSWWLKSNKDTRWDSHGKDDFIGGFVMPSSLKDRIEELKKKFGVPPDDLKWGYMKD